MTSYLLIYFIVGSLAFLDLTNANKRVSRVLLFLVLLIFLGFRDNTGIDFSGYKRIFLDQNSYGIERGYLFFQDVSKHIYNNFNFFIFLCSFLTLYLKFSAFKKICPMTGIAVLFYLGFQFFDQDTNQIRQGLAIGFALLSMHHIANKEKYKFLLLILIGSLFHISSLIFLLAYFIYNLKLNRVILSLFIIISFSLLFIDISRILSPIFMFVSKLFASGPIKVKLITYLVTSKKYGFYYGSVILLFLMSLFILYRNKINSTFYNGVLNCFVFGACFNWLLNSLENFSRLSFFFIALGGILYSYVIFSEKRLFLRVVLFCTLFLISMAKAVQLVSKYSDSYIPYKSILF